MTLKQPIEVRSVKTGRFTVETAAVGDVSTAEFSNVPRAVRVLNNVAKALTIGQSRVDIRKINRVLREPQEPKAEVTSIEILASTR